ncbi:MAG: S8 family serine peptidase [Promethearchaeota archaeon]
MKSNKFFFIFFFIIVILVSPIFGVGIASLPSYTSSKSYTDVVSLTEESDNASFETSGLAELIPLIKESSRISVRFTRELTHSEMATLEENGIHFGNTPMHVGDVYIVDITLQGLDYLGSYPLFRKAEPLIHSKGVPPRDFSIPDVQADLVWNLQNTTGLNLTGEGILIANLDTGIQWRHPDFFFADGGSYNWLDNNTNNQFDNGTDGIDLNSSGTIEPKEKLYAINTDVYTTSYESNTDWLLLDNGTTIGTIDEEDTFFIINDTTGDDALNTTESLIALKTPKTKHIVYKNNSVIVHWDRGVNLTSCPLDDDPDGHGTSVASILLGGQLGHRKYLGVAPKAELMSIDIFGSYSLTVQEGLVWANNSGADVILIEIGSWTYEYLDGSSNTEAMIDQLTAQGIPVIVPAGNLGGANRHALRNGLASSVLDTQFQVPNLSPDIYEVYITILTRDSFNNNIQVNITEPTGGPPIVHQVPLGIGYQNWVYSYGTNIDVAGFLANSTRNTHMIGLYLNGSFTDIGPYILHILSPFSANYHCYIADDVTGWSGGTHWLDGVDETTIITWPSTADTAISVGSYHTRSIYASPGDIAAYSPSGPRIDGVLKMSVVAPGGFEVISAWSNYSLWNTNDWFFFGLYENYGSYRSFGGTSAASPHVAGAAALLLQYDSSIGSNIKSILEATTYVHWNMPALPDQRWGYGRLDILAALLNISTIPVITNVSRHPAAGALIEATINVPIDRAALNITYTTDNWASNTNISMTYVGGSSFTGEIPYYPYGTLVKYKVYAFGHGWFRVSSEYNYTSLGDTTPPVIHSVQRNVTTVYANKNVQISANVTDLGSGINFVQLNWTSDNWGTYTLVNMTLQSGFYIATISGFPVGTVIKYYIFAEDNVGLKTISSEYSYTVQVQTTTPTSTTTSPTTTPTTSVGEPYFIIFLSVFMVAIVVLVKRRRR